MDNIDRNRSDFRNAMARLGAAVNIITSNGPAGRCGITATAVCSISDAPPTMLVCLNRSSAMNQVFKDNGMICINVLAAEQEARARDFAGMTGVAMEDRFADPSWQEGRLHRTEEVGSHSILIVAIEKIDLPAQGRDSLIYFDRLFHRIPHQKVELNHA